MPFNLLPTVVLALLWSSSVSAQGYAPNVGPCPSDFTLVRAANSTGSALSSQESQYISTRAQQVLPNAFQTYLSNVQASSNSSNSTLPSYVSSILTNTSSLPKVGIALSGGGYRAAIFGAGVLNALDGRNSSSVKVGTGGLLQSASYIAGLSGGSWLLTSFIQADFPTIQELAFGPSNPTSDGFGGWNAQLDVTEPGSNAGEDFSFIEGLVAEISPKLAKGFPLTVTDIWGAALARHFVNGTTASNFFSNSSDHGATITFSQIANVSTFVNHQQPFPFIVTDSRLPADTNIADANGSFVPFTNNLYEINVFEFGSWDPSLASFAPTQFMGTTNTSVCVTGFDRASYVEGASSDLFNEFNATLTALLDSSIGPLITIINSTFGPHQPLPISLDAAAVPNPFKGVNSGSFGASPQDFLTLVDGGEDGQVIPIQPLLIPERGLDIVIAVDAANDENGFVDGTSIIATANRSAIYPSTYPLPPIPKSNVTFVNKNLVLHPTFFGCTNFTASNGTTGISVGDTSTPLLIYIGNGGPPANGAAPLTNTSTFQTTYNASQLQGFLDQTFQIATQGFPSSNSSSNGSTSGEGVDPEWAACLACAVVDRARERSGVERDGVCSGCFERYCWDGEEVATNSSSSSSSGGSMLGMLL
ncbi:lysophospholipase [Sistotremastrum niveocremeum HHB9708]|uniref:Lysophospholipase n=1 Tax=Sistotremastrum niveocremeum HHB9708 TaxID=1314777 RepID=A0A164X5N7_9AGAM|nr:lysophospholipase [Sistotremastrum niveocremeum HHB9708]